jgi:hydrogenase expression/formation protein HypE
LKIGKVKNSELEKYVFKNVKIKRPEVVLSGGTGIDTAVLDFENDLIVTSTDPITGASKNIGSLAIHISVNDVCSQGADPVGVLLTVLLPPSAEIKDLEEIMIDCNRACEKLNLDIMGGHTEVTDAVNKIILSTTVIGRVDRNGRLSVKNVKDKDVIVVSKYIGVEGTSIIYHDEPGCKDILSSDDKEVVEKLQDEISVKDEAMLAKKHGVKHMHDITEGGIYGALWETSKATGKGISVDKNKIPVLDATRKIAKHYDIDPYKLISSGSMIMIFDRSDFKEFKEAAKRKNLKVTEIGEMNNSGVAEVYDGDKIFTLSDPEPDELYKVIK